jgi:hypothetical protein
MKRTNAGMIDADLPKIHIIKHMNGSDVIDLTILGVDLVDNHFSIITYQ